MSFHFINRLIFFSSCSRKPTREFIYVEGESDDAALEAELEPEEEDSPSVTFSKKHRDIMGILNLLFADRFKLEDQEFIPEAQRLFNYGSSTPCYVLKPIILRGSFLDPPVWPGEASNTGSWPRATRFPRNVIPYKTGFSLKPPGRPIDIYIEDDNLRALLTAPKISEANLDATISFSSQSIKLSGTSFPNTDFFQRMALLDGLYTEDLLSCALQFMPRLREEMLSTFGDFNTESMDFLEKLLGLISFSNQRGVHNNVAAFVSNKAGMRSHVLSRFQVPQVTAQMLKNSTFTCEGVFGELPQAFLNKFSSVTGSALVCRPKSKNVSSAVSSGQGRGQKRGGNQYGNQYNQSAKKGKASGAYNQQGVFPLALTTHRGGGATSKSFRGKGTGRGKN